MIPADYKPPTCAHCGAKDAPFGFGFGKYHLCYPCWLTTPEGQRQTSIANRRMTTEGLQDHDEEE